MYALVLSYRRRPALRAVAAAHRAVLGTIAAALAPLVPGLHCDGTSDLVLGGRKVSGNSLRAKREHLLYHGTLLYDFPLELIARCLAMPPRAAGLSRGPAARGLPGEPAAAGRRAPPGLAGGMGTRHEPCERLAPLGRWPGLPPQALQ